MVGVLVWPFKMLWNLVALSATVIGAIIGIPLVVFGGALILRGLF